MTPLRCLPVPDTEPVALRLRAPSRPAPAAVVQGSLALALPAEPDHGPAGHDAGPLRGGPAALPDARATAAVLVQAVVEVLAGSRPGAQLARWLSPDVLAAVQRRAAVATRQRRDGPAPQRHAQVRRVLVCHPAAGVAEACAVVVGAQRVRAVALRLEGVDGRWRATALELG